MNSWLSGRIVLSALAAVLLLSGFGLTNLVVSSVSTYTCFFSFALHGDACWLLAGVSLFSGIAAVALGSLVTVQGVLPHHLPVRLKQSRIYRQAVIIASISVSGGILLLLSNRTAGGGFGYLMILGTLGAIAFLWLASIRGIRRSSGLEAARGPEEAADPSASHKESEQ